MRPERGCHGGRRPAIHAFLSARPASRNPAPWLLLLAAAAALLWFVPFAWMVVASIRHDSTGAADLASLLPSGPFSPGNFVDAWQSGHFPLWYLNTIILCGGILIVQCVTVSLAGYAFARMRFPGQNTLFALFLLQLMLVPPILIVPNMTTLVTLHLYDTLPGIMAPYFASAFGVFLMRQTFRGIPKEYEEAALVDGASRLRIITHVLLPLSRPGLTAFAIVSVTSHWNEFLWPLMATSSPSNQVLTVGLATFTAGAEAGSEWGVIAAGTFFVAAPLLVAFVLFQRRFVSSFTFSGIK
jgi:sn-glycerol 3-phosphate transport system permease protein